MKLNKKIILIIIIAVIAAVALSYFAFSYYPEYKKTQEVNNFKKVRFDSIVCQYSCPIINQTLQNKSVMAPNATCVQECALPVLALQNTSFKISDQDLLSDNLIQDITNTQNTCKTESLNASTYKIDNVKYFNCVSTRLPSLKENYTYLK